MERQVSEVQWITLIDDDMNPDQLSKIVAQLVSKHPPQQFEIGNVL